MILTRYAYTPTETQGMLRIGMWTCHTIEQPWVQHDNRGGKPFMSCIPEGVYKVAPFKRPNGDEVLSIVNEELGVFLYDHERTKDNNGRAQGRYLCLIHAGNRVRDVEGCIAPGDKRLTTDEGMMVTNSRATMVEIMLRSRSETTLEIQQGTGAIDTPLV